jgi:hypothetical protein
LFSTESQNKQQKSNKKSLSGKKRNVIFVI